jgi:hypothetical protein
VGRPSFATVRNTFKQDKDGSLFNALTILVDQTTRDFGSGQKLQGEVGIVCGEAVRLQLPTKKSPVRIEKARLSRTEGDLAFRHVRELEPAVRPRQSACGPGRYTLHERVVYRFARNGVCHRSRDNMLRRLSGKLLGLRKLLGRSSLLR